MHFTWYQVSIDQCLFDKWVLQLMICGQKFINWGIFQRDGDFLMWAQVLGSNCSRNYNKVILTMLEGSPINCRLEMPFSSFLVFNRSIYNLIKQLSISMLTRFDPLFLIFSFCYGDSMAYFFLPNVLCIVEMFTGRAECFLGGT